MPNFLIRSMSTTDYRPADRYGEEQKSRPYHIYLLPIEKRAGAWWTPSSFYAMKFATREDAQFEVDRLKPSLDDAEIAPVDARGLPTFWENRKAQSEARS